MEDQNDKANTQKEHALYIKSESSCSFPPQAASTSKREYSHESYYSIKRTKSKSGSEANGYFAQIPELPIAREKSRKGNRESRESKSKSAENGSECKEVKAGYYVVPEYARFLFGKVFDSIEAALTAMTEYEQHHNLKFCISRTSHIRKQYEYRCIFGRAVGQGTKIKGLGCPAKIRIYYRVRDNGYTVKELGREHSHRPVLPSFEKKKVLVPEEVVPLIKEMNRCGTTPDIILEYCKKLYYRRTGKKLLIGLEKICKFIEANLKN
eukprot:TRINITY_DN5635_c0_g2_i5.p1 TRINITY_DN5635_c0_g2~~TRINITY_DN5635_c0_g2_i5.p1  ORF type:complete len:266 (+),score=76.58 TRINITY_DN5635_c0_g2_i5:161-958(+)